jgi:hypothetical protein
VAHQHGAQGIEFAIGEVVLLQDADPQPLRNDDVPGGLLELPGEDLQQRGLAGAVRADQPVTVAAGEFQRDILEQNASAELEGQVLCRDHPDKVAGIGISRHSPIEPRMGACGHGGR